MALVIVIVIQQKIHVQASDQCYNVAQADLILSKFDLTSIFSVRGFFETNLFFISKSDETTITKCHNF